MKRNFRDKDGQFVTIKEWFEQNDDLYISCISVDRSYKHCASQLERMLQFQTESLSKIELALVGAAEIVVYQGDNPAIKVDAKGTVWMWGGEYSSAAMQYDPKLLQRFKDVVQQRIDEQRAIVARAEATFVEVED